jgi:hypothetical protein
MTTYYRGPDVLITDRVFVIWTPPQRIYRIRELSDCCVLVGDRPPIRLYAAGAVGGAVFVAVATASALHTPTDLMVGTVLMGMASAVAGACVRTRPEYELCGMYRGLRVTLFCSSDPIAFGQVKRALLRALERRAYDLEQLQTR